MLLRFIITVLCSIIAIWLIIKEDNINLNK